MFVRFFCSTGIIRLQWMQKTEMLAHLCPLLNRFFEKTVKFGAKNEVLFHRYHHENEYCYIGPLLPIAHTAEFASIELKV
jgi:hypothetical protein